MSNYVVTFPLKTEKWQEDLLEKYFNRCRSIKNKLNGVVMDAYKKHETEFKEIEDETFSIYKKKKENGNLSKEDEKRLTELKNKRKDIINSITTDDVEGLPDYPKTRKLLDKYGLIAVCDKLLKLNIGGKTDSGENIKYNDVFPRITTNITHPIAKDCSMAWDKFLWGTGKSISFKKKDEFNTIKIEYKEDKTSFIKIDKDNHTVNFNSQTGFTKGKTMSIPFEVNPNHEYENVALSQEIVMITIKRTMIRGKMKYSLQFTFEGTHFNKGRALGEGSIGVDPGTSSVTFFGKTVRQYRNHEDIEKLDKIKAELERSLDRKRRAANPNKYNEDGTYKRGNRDKWVKTKNYIKDFNKLKEVCRKSTEKKKLAQIEFVNSILSEGNTLKIENNDINSWTVKSKETKVNKNGRNMSKKRYGKSVSNTAPSQLLTLAKNKFEQLGGKVIEVNQFTAKATGTDHTDNVKYTKKPVGVTRVTLSDGKLHHRDAHAAFNLKHWDNDNNKYNVDGMNNDYQHYCEEEAKALERNEIKFSKK